jgi:16S rRNA (uracil1498-N3)-methyltransferase
MHRFFVSPESIRQTTAVLRGQQAHQIYRVLRLRPGEHVLLLDNSGSAYESVLAGCDEGTARFEIAQRLPVDGEPHTHITLYQAVLKGESFGWALQKGTEIGVSCFVPMICERSVISDPGAVDQRRERWTRIIQEAAEQSGRAHLPELAPVQLFATAVRAAAPASEVLRLIPWEEARTTHLSAALADCNFAAGARIQLYIGPEGGFTAEEVDLARGYGIMPVTLGSRILRAETAGIVAAAAVLYAAGEI